MQHRRIHGWRLMALATALPWLAGCAQTLRIDDPLAELGKTGISPRLHIAAMEMLDQSPEDEAYLKALHRMIWVPGLTVQVREAALARLERTDPEGLKKTIRRHLPNMMILNWLERLCEVIADRGWVELTPGLVSSWAWPKTRGRPETERPEFQALAKLHGEDQVLEVVFRTFTESRRVAQQGLRTRAWELLHRLGERDRLIALLAEQTPPEEDLMLADLHAAAEELGLVPYNREEILWLRTLRQPEQAEFWSRARAAVSSLDPSRRSELQVRDLAVLLAADRHAPALLGASKAELYEMVAARVKGQRHYAHGSNFEGMKRGRAGRLHEYRQALTWGDLLAMVILGEALDVPEVRAHLFDYAERDRADESTEYGGVITLDAKDRFELREFPPVVRQHDQKFFASQAMFDAAATALFHFHLHVQRVRNTDYAGPGYGDVNYAENTRANCVVFTSVNARQLNVDFYRHGGVMIDLGVVDRP